MYLNKILLTTDFSEASKSAFGMALHQAQLSHSDLTILNVFEPVVLPISAEGYMPPVDFIDQLEAEHLENCRLKLDEILDEDFPHSIKESSTEEGGVLIKTVALKSWSSAAESITQFAADNKFGLIIIANQGKGAIKRLFVGSTTERVARLASVPVLIVPARHDQTNSDATGILKHIVVCTDFSDDSMAAFKYAAYEAKLHQAQVSIIHVVQQAIAPEILSRSRRPSLATSFDIERIQNEYVKGLELKLEGYVISHFPLLKVESKLLDKAFPTSVAITEYCRQTDCDLLVMATHGQNKGLHLLGSVSERVLRETSCPMLLVPKHEKANHKIR